MRYYEVNFNISASTATMQDARDLTVAIAGEAGFEAFEDTEKGVKGYIQTDLFNNDAIKDALNFFPIDGVSISYTVKPAEYKNWNESWEKEGFAPIVIDNRCVIHDGKHPYSHLENEISIEIDAKLAFGTGNHDTTRMIISNLLNTDLKNKNVLDCGCGTGILGIVCLKCGAKSVTGYDIDEWSVDNSRHNATINGVDSLYESQLGNSSILDGINKKFDIILANINRNIILEDLPRLRNAMGNNALLILSGFYDEDKEIIKEDAEKTGLKLKSVRTENKWTCMTFSD